jgi:hypothetical protein
VYLYSNGFIVRLETGNGKVIEIPISGLSLSRVDKLGGLIHLYANNQRFFLKVKSAYRVDPSLLYAISHPQVTRIDV